MREAFSPLEAATRARGSPRPKPASLAPELASSHSPYHHPQLSERSPEDQLCFWNCPWTPRGGARKRGGGGGADSAQGARHAAPSPRRLDGKGERRAASQLLGMPVTQSSPHKAPGGGSWSPGTFSLSPPRYLSQPRGASLPPGTRSPTQPLTPGAGPCCRRTPHTTPQWEGGRGSEAQGKPSQVRGLQFAGTESRPRLRPLQPWLSLAPGRCRLRGPGWLVVCRQEWRRRRRRRQPSEMLPSRAGEKVRATRCQQPQPRSGRTRRSLSAADWQLSPISSVQVYGEGRAVINRGSGGGAPQRLPHYCRWSAAGCLCNTNLKRSAAIWRLARSGARARTLVWPLPPHPARGEACRTDQPEKHCMFTCSGRQPKGQAGGRPAQPLMKWPLTEEGSPISTQRRGHNRGLELPLFSLSFWPRDMARGKSTIEAFHGIVVLGRAAP